MKTQIKNLRSGTKNQLLNPEVDYSTLKPATGHNGHAGTNLQEVTEVWKKIKSENPDCMNISLKGLEITLQAEWSVSGKSVSYVTELPKHFVEDELYLECSSNPNIRPMLTIDGANSVRIHNGKNSYKHICPSLIEIL